MRKLLCALAALCMALLPGLAAAQPAPGSIYWGAMLSGPDYGYGNVPTDMRAVYAFESDAGKNISILGIGNGWQAGGGWFYPFPTGDMQNIRDHGSIPLFTWTSMGVDNSQFSNAIILSGRYDAYIHAWAKAAGAWGHPFFLRFDHEMDGSWYPWAEGGGLAHKVPNGNAPGSYVRMYRHVHDIFAQEGAYNVTWVWAVNHECVCPGKYAPYSQVFPGANYINWLGIDAYNRFPNQWLSFSAMLSGGQQGLRDSYTAVHALAPDKPLMLPEFGSVEKPGDPNAKAAWYKDALQTQIPYNYPALHAVVYFNWALNQGDLPIESSPQAQAAWAQGIAAPYYATNTYGTLPYPRILR